MPNSRRSSFATPPAATRAAVSRALARSSTSRASSAPYLSMPAKSAWPGRTRVIGLRLTAAASTAITWRQFSQSRLAISSVIGDPSVKPPRTPATMWAASCSMAIRPPRPCPPCRRVRSRARSSSRTVSPAGTPSRITVSRSPCDSPAVSNRRVMPAPTRGPTLPALRQWAPSGLSRSQMMRHPGAGAWRDPQPTGGSEEALIGS